MTAKNILGKIMKNCSKSISYPACVPLYHCVVKDIVDHKLSGFEVTDLSKEGGLVEYLTVRVMSDCL